MTFRVPSQHLRVPLTPRWLLVLLLLTCGAFAVLGYHPGVEDDTTYLAAVKHDLNPALYPHDLPFVTAQLQFSIYDRLIAGSVRLAHLPLAAVLLLWQLAALYLLLLGCWLIAAECFREASARWAGVTFVAVMLAMPVSATKLFLVDQHLHPRLLATDCILLAVHAILRRRRLPALLLLLAGVLLHPLMAAFGISFCCFLLLAQHGWFSLRDPLRPAAALAGADSWLLEKPNAAWEHATGPRTFLYLYRWPWYAWLSVLGPVALAFLLRGSARRRGERQLAVLASALCAYSLFQLGAAMMLLLPWCPEWLLQFEPMRFLHLTYLFTSLLGAAAFGRWWLKAEAIRWVLLFLPLAAGMYVDQATEFAGSPHIEWPGTDSANPWLQAFAWVRTHTPNGAYFALDPLYTTAAQEGVHSFRALAERSMLADAVKDRTVITHVPHLAPRWLRETDATAGWQHFHKADFEQLRRQFGVDWALVEHPVAGLTCPYHNSMVWVCRISPDSPPVSGLRTAAIQHGVDERRDPRP